MPNVLETKIPGIEKASAALLVLSNFIWIMKLCPVRKKIQKKRHQLTRFPFCIMKVALISQHLPPNKQQLLLYLENFLSIQNNQFLTSISIQIKVEGAFLTVFSEVHESLLIEEIHHFIDQCAKRLDPRSFFVWNLKTRFVSKIIVGA